MATNDEEFQKWSNDVAVLAADAMIDAKLISKDQLEDTVEVIREEICVRLIMSDYPKPLKGKESLKKIE